MGARNIQGSTRIRAVLIESKNLTEAKKYSGIHTLKFFYYYVNVLKMIKYFRP